MNELALRLSNPKYGVRSTDAVCASTGLESLALAPPLSFSFSFSCAEPHGCPHEHEGGSDELIINRVVTPQHYHIYSGKMLLTCTYSQTLGITI